MFVYEAKHLLLDGLANRSDALLDVELGKSCLTEIAHRIGMTVIHPAVGVEFPHNGTSSAVRLNPSTRLPQQQMSGYSAFVLLAESHLSIHTFPEASFLTFDFYSCVAFETAQVVEILEAVFDLGQREVRVADRHFSSAGTLSMPSRQALSE